MESHIFVSMLLAYIIVSNIECLPRPRKPFKEITETLEFDPKGTNGGQGLGLKGIKYTMKCCFRSGAYRRNRSRKHLGTTEAPLEPTTLYAIHYGNENEGPLTSYEHSSINEPQNASPVIYEEQNPNIQQETGSASNKEQETNVREDAVSTTNEEQETNVRQDAVSTTNEEQETNVRQDAGSTANDKQETNVEQDAGSPTNENQDTGSAGNGHQNFDKTASTRSTDVNTKLFWISNEGKSDKPEPDHVASSSFDQKLSTSNSAKTDQNSLTFNHEKQDFEQSEDITKLPDSEKNSSEIVSQSSDLDVHSGSSQQTTTASSHEESS